MTKTKPLRGSWIPINADGRGYTDCFQCSICQCKVYLYSFSQDCDYIFCPYCGKEMEDE